MESITDIQDQGLDNLNQTSPSKDQIVIPTATPTKQNQKASDEWADEEFEVKTQDSTPEKNISDLLDRLSVSEFSQNQNAQYKSNKTLTCLLTDLQQSFNDIEVEGEKYSIQGNIDLFTFILKTIERVSKAFGIRITDRSYRQKFSKAYKTQMEQCGSLDDFTFSVDILDSAQDNYSHIWVNGEKYVFSEDVIGAGKMVFSQFLELKESLEFKSIFDSNRFQYQKFLENLEKFDKYWATYE